MLVTEFASGGSLDKRIASAPLDPKEVIRIGVQICKGLAAVHRPPLNGVHRDIKPSNILFDDLERAKVADLGLVQIYGVSARSEGLATQHPGTPGYMSPEQEAETGYLTPASDIYSIGCVLFEALTQKLYQHQPPGTKASTLVAEVPRELDAVLEKALVEDPNERYQDAEAMQAAIEGVRVRPSTATPSAAEFQFRGGARARSAEVWAEQADKNWACDFRRQQDWRD